jgi:hypothetical protein
MLATRTRLGVLMAILVCTFGCKGAGGAFKVVGAAALVGARVGAAAIAAAPPSSGGGWEAPPADAYPGQARCIQLAPGPDGVRAASCGGRLYVQDPWSGRWHE